MYKQTNKQTQNVAYTRRNTIENEMSTHMPALTPLTPEVAGRKATAAKGHVWVGGPGVPGVFADV